MGAANGSTNISWNVEHTLIPSLLDAAATTEAIIARDFVQILYCVPCSGAVDSSLEHGGAGAPALAAIAADMAIYASSWDDDALIAAWAIGATDELRRDLADEALAIWRMFVRTAGVAGLDAEAATDNEVSAYKTARANVAYVWRDPSWATEGYRIWEDADDAVIATVDATEGAVWPALMQIPASLSPSH